MKHTKEFENLCEDAKKNVNEVSVEEVMKKLDAGERFHFLDCREDHEWEKGRCKGSKHLSRGIIERDIANLVAQKDDEIVVYCGGGYRSALACESLQKMGYRNIYSMAGGIRKWRENDLPEES